MKKNRQLSGEASVSPAYHEEPADVPVNYSFQEAVIHLYKQHNKWESSSLAKATFRPVSTLSIFL